MGKEWWQCRLYAGERVQVQPNLIALGTVLHRASSIQQAPFCKPIQIKHRQALDQNETLILEVASETGSRVFSLVVVVVSVLLCSFPCLLGLGFLLARTSHPAAGRLAQQSSVVTLPNKALFRYSSIDPNPYSLSYTPIHLNTCVLRSILEYLNQLQSVQEDFLLYYPLTMFSKVFRGCYSVLCLYIFSPFFYLF